MNTTCQSFHRQLNIQLELPSQSYKTYIWCRTSNESDANEKDYHYTTLLESGTTIENGTTGMRTWSASLLLSQFIISNPEIVVGKRVLELGCGMGLLGAIVADQQLSFSTSTSTCGSICLTDVDERVLSRCRENMEIPGNASSAHPRITYRTLDWSDALDPTNLPVTSSIMQNEMNSDVILGADLVFDPSLIPALVRTIVLALQPGPCPTEKVVFLSLTLRREDTFAKFVQTCVKAGLRMEDVRFSPDKRMFLGMSEGDDVRLFKILKT